MIRYQFIETSQLLAVQRTSAPSFASVLHTNHDVIRLWSDLYYYQENYRMHKVVFRYCEDVSIQLHITSIYDIKIV